jgi:hypothetical protein
MHARPRDNLRAFSMNRNHSLRLFDLVPNARLADVESSQVEIHFVAMAAHAQSLREHERQFRLVLLAPLVNRFHGWKSAHLKPTE